jgi:hypothetical protein
MVEETLTMVEETLTMVEETLIVVCGTKTDFPEAKPIFYGVVSCFSIASKTVCEVPAVLVYPHNKVII